MRYAPEELFNIDFLGKNSVVTCCPECGHIDSSDNGYPCYCGCKRVIFTPMKVSVFNGLSETAQEAWKANARIKYCKEVKAFDKQAFDAWVARTFNMMRTAFQEIAQKHPDKVLTDPSAPSYQSLQQQAYVPRCPTCGCPNIVHEPRYLGWGNRTTFRCSNCNYTW